MQFILTLLQSETETSQGISNKEPHVEDMEKDTKSSFNLGNNVNGYSCELENSVSGRTCKDVYDRDLTILLLKKEIESALISLRGVQSQMAKILNEKEEMRKSEEQGQKSIQCLRAQVLTLQEEISSMEEQFNLKTTELDNKLQTVKEIAQQASNCWCQRKEVKTFTISVLFCQKMIA